MCLAETLFDHLNACGVESLEVWKAGIVSTDVIRVCNTSGGSGTWMI